MRYAIWVLLIYILLSPFIANKIPATWIWENGPLEWTQVALLTLCLGLSIWWARIASRMNDPFSALFWGWLVIAWVLFIGRELSWGRVFMMDGFYMNGPKPISIEKYPYTLHVRAIQAILGIIYIGAIVRFRLYRFPFALMKFRRFPWPEIIVTIIGIVVSDIGGKMFHSARYEECGEIGFYIGTVLVVLAMMPRRPSLTTLLSPESTPPADSNNTVEATTAEERHPV